MSEEKSKPSKDPTPSPPEELNVLPVTHDRFFTETFQTKRLAKAFLRNRLPGELVKRLDLDGLTIEPRHITDNVFKELITDVVYRVPVKGTPNHVDFFTVLEHKSFDDRLTIFQLWSYVFHICLREFRQAKIEDRIDSKYRLPPVIAIILHHGESKFSGKTQLSDLFVSLPGIEEYLPKLQAILIDLNTISDAEVPDDPDVPELKVVLMVLKTVFRKDVGTKIKTILKELKPYSEDPEMRRLIRFGWLYLVSSAKHLERNYEVLFDTIKQVVEEDETMSTMLEKWATEREARGEARGVVRILTTRFGRVPQAVSERLLAIGDLVVLDSLTELAVTCKSLDEFKKALK